MNNSGQLGNGTLANSGTPVAVSGISNAVSVSAGYYHSCAVLANGAVQCWGSSDYGRLGNGAVYSISTPLSTPVSVIGISNAVSVSAGSHSCALLNSGDMLCWGDDHYGQLGTGRLVLSFSPISVLGAGGHGLLNLLSSPPTSSLVDDADKVFAWAEKTYGTVFSPTGQTTQTIPGYRFRAYSAHYLAVNDDSGTAHLYYLGPLSSNTVLDLGLLSMWVTQAGQ